MGDPSAVVPVAGAEVFRLGQEIGPPAAVQFRLHLNAPRQQLLSAVLEGPVELGQERERLGREDFGQLSGNRSQNLDAIRAALLRCHGMFPRTSEPTGASLNTKAARSI